MSRRRGEFEHRTSIFEGAFRAWSHLGGLDPADLDNKTAADLDPLRNPIVYDSRISDSPPGGGGSDDTKSVGGTINENEEENKEDNGQSSTTTPRFYPYEPLPRTGLSHPFVVAIISPWLGPGAEQEEVSLGLSTLRTWWQHRRKGESKTAIEALGTDKMAGVVEGYTRHFYNLAHCLVVNDAEIPPRTLATKMKALEKLRFKRKTDKAAPSLENVNKVHSMISKEQGIQSANSKRKLEGEDDSDSGSLGSQGNGTSNGNGIAIGAVTSGSTQHDEDNLTPLERLHSLQRRQLEVNGFIPSNADNDMPAKKKNMTSSCCSGGGTAAEESDMRNRLAAAATQDEIKVESSRSSSSSRIQQYGDMNRTPVVFVTESGVIQIAMKVDGVTCSSCIKIIEKVLTSGRPPISGILDAVADQELKAAIIRIDKSSSAKRIAFEASERLSMMGYEGKAIEMDIADLNVKEKKGMRMDINVLTAAFDVVASTANTTDIFDWSKECVCSDGIVSREGCERHSQMSPRVFEAFEERATKVSEFVSGCGSKFGLKCSCGTNCKCDPDRCNCNPKSTAQDVPISNGATTKNNINAAPRVISTTNPVIPTTNTLSAEPSPLNGLTAGAGMPSYLPSTMNPAVAASGASSMHDGHIFEQQLQLQQIAMMNNMNNQRLLALQSRTQQQQQQQQQQIHQAALSGILSGVAGGPSVGFAGANVLSGGLSSGGMMHQSAIHNYNGLDSHLPPTWPDNNANLSMAGIMNLDAFGAGQVQLDNSNFTSGVLNHWDGTEDLNNGDRR